MPEFEHGIWAAMIVVLYTILVAWGGFFLRHMIDRIVDRLRPDRPPGQGKP